MKNLWLLLAMVLLSIGVQGQNVFINEIQSNDAGTDDAEFIELIGPGGTDISGWAITHYNGSGATPVFTFTFPDCTKIPEDGVRDKSGQLIGFMVVKHTGHLVPNADFEWGTQTLQNGPDGLELLDSEGIRRQALSWNGLGDLGGGLPAWRNIGTDNNDDLSLSAPDEVGESFQSSWANVEATPGMINSNQLSGDISLPVLLLYFIARGGDGSVQLRWATGAELNNLGFIIDRALEKDGTYSQLASYETASELRGAGNSSSPKNYNYCDLAVFNGVTYYYKLSDVDINGVRHEHGPVQATPAPAVTGPKIEKPGPAEPEYFLKQNYPNPFNPHTCIELELSNCSEDPVDLTVYNLAGQKVTTLYQGKIAGTYLRVEWDGRNDYGQLVAGGVYFYVLRAPTFYVVNKMMLLR
jgi:hypothetical protein